MEINKKTILLCAAAAFLGLMMLFSPATFIKVIIIAAGCACVVSGVLALSGARTLIEDPVYSWCVTGRAILCIIVGALAVILPLAIAKTAWTVMLYILAVELLVSAAVEVYTTLKLKAADVDCKFYWGEIIVSAAVSLVLFLMPAKIGSALIRIVGACILIAAIALFIWEYRSNKGIDFTVETLDD